MQEIGKIMIKNTGYVTVKDKDSLDIAKVFLEMLRNRVSSEKQFKTC